MLQTFPIHPVFQTMVTKDFKITTSFFKDINP